MPLLIRIFFTLCLSNLFLPSLLPADERPNIVLILAKDLGRDWVSCYGASHQTPNVDRLAKHGVREIRGIQAHASKRRIDQLSTREVDSIAMTVIEGSSTEIGFSKARTVEVLLDEFRTKEIRLVEIGAIHVGRHEGDPA